MFASCHCAFDFSGFRSPNVQGKNASTREHSNTPVYKRLKLLSALFMPCREEGHSPGKVINLHYQEEN